MDITSKSNTTLEFDKVKEELAEYLESQKNGVEKSDKTETENKKEDFGKKSVSNKAEMSDLLIDAEK